MKFENINIKIEHVQACSLLLMLGSGKPVQNAHGCINVGHHTKRISGRCFKNKNKPSWE